MTGETALRTGMNRACVASFGAGVAGEQIEIAYVVCTRARIAAGTLSRVTQLATHVDAPAPGPARVELAAAWRRLAAYLLDTAPTLAVVVALTSPGRALLVVGGAWPGVTAVYQAGFLRWRGATPGKRALGLRVRLLERPGTLPWRAVVRRLLVQLVPVALAATPWCPGLGRLVPLLGTLAVLRDDRGRAWHDLAAGTCVVRGHGSAATWDVPPADGSPPPPAW